ncbi:MAG: hypothetical protein JRE40_04960 [Deltaproteobacteria bacterium]|nr:hypothetical protein [Deltaproteobacteria bacterium]
MNPREETTLVKRALLKAGFSKEGLSVSHDTGTAAHWLNIKVGQLPGLTTYETVAKALRIAQQATGRGGDYSGRISVHIVEQGAER